MIRDKSAVVRTVFASIMLAVSIFLAFLLAVLDYDFFSIKAMEAVGGGEQLAQGLSLAIVVVLIICGAIALALISLIGAILSVTVIKACAGGARMYGVVSLIIQLVFLVFAVVSFMIMLLAG